MQILNNKNFAAVAQTTMAAVAIETTLKAVGRPAFIYRDKSADPETKKYAATKEFLYQVVALCTYLALVIPGKKLGFKLSKKIFKSDINVQKLLANCKKGLINNKGKHIKGYDCFMKTYKTAKENEKTTDPLHKVKGCIEASSLISSVLGLAILAPEISHRILHPIMEYLGFEKHS
jgi:hypothetical protein